jgi:hypothetical protein
LGFAINNANPELNSNPAKLAELGLLIIGKLQLSEYMIKQVSEQTLIARITCDLDRQHQRLFKSRKNTRTLLSLGNYYLLKTSMRDMFDLRQAQ